MKIEITIPHTVDVQFLHVSAGVRYWEDAYVNDVKDEAGDLIPCRNRDKWEPIIELSTGKILNWEQGKKADIHYKICDDGTYTLKGEVTIIYGGYVPTMMSPFKSGSGDYIIMQVNEDGIIDKWKPYFEEFIEEGNIIFEN
jgi:hypothetical protein